MERSIQAPNNYPVGTADWLMASADTLRRSLPMDDRVRLMLTGSYAVSILSTDVVLLPTRVPHLIAAFEGEALSFTCPDGRVILVPGGLVRCASYSLDNLQMVNSIRAATSSLRVGEGGDLKVPGVSGLEREEGVSIACGGSQVEILNRGVPKHTLEAEREEIDKFFDSFGGLSTELVSSGLPEVAA